MDSPDSPAPSFSERLRELIAEDRRSVKAIAAEAGVNYAALWRWFTRRTSVYPVDSAEAVYQTLTGEPFPSGK